ncbi:Nicotinamidase-related amidase [Malonomonas rubra DSM 5091]|uniref:Nicotinamidase-related amidase n=1 Tax=Malonomonas rubra DSM 5091 TaxID=1122189 RepID=A0A1M6HFV7_MALRU|nr:isochorismatase family protein [Malonomonas rubra]SHJ21098.1 Nicotinamidase-related amidase [Malonomonas rubra DSM 5091]
MAEIKDKFWLQKEQAALVVVDIQEKLVPAMDPAISERLVKHVDMLVQAFQAMELPIIVTEQYPRGLGNTIGALSTAAEKNCVEKTAFSCAGEPNFVSALEKTGAKQVVLVGMEAHVCVYQTMIDLIDRGYRVHLVTDAICSRFKSDYQTAIAMASQMGAVLTTTEMALFQLVGVAGGDIFKLVSKLVRQRNG